MAFMVMFSFQRKAYDLATAIFFAVGLGLMARGKWSEYFAVLGLAAVNRETAFLLVMVFVIWRLVDKGIGDRGYWLSVGWQLAILLVVRICLMVIFAGSHGPAFSIQLLGNLRMFGAHPFQLVIEMFGFLFVWWWCVRRWGEQPRLLKVAFLVMAPLLMVMYLVVGWAFEIRVFAEVFPVAWFMCLADRKIEG